MPGPLVVVGDTLLDRDLTGTVDRLCPDAPAPVLDVRDSLDRPGGAGLAAALAAELGVEVALVTGLGSDAGAERLRELLLDVGVKVYAVPMVGPTPEKVRVRAGGQVLLRVDRAGARDQLDEVPPEALSVLNAANAVLVSDYGRGMTSLPAVRRAVQRAARRRSLVWDPHPRGADPVPGAGLVTPNESELGQRVPEDGGRRPGRLASLARRAELLRERWDARAIAVTLGGDGALVSHGGTTPLVVPAPARHGGDTCGAGDRFAAAATVALSRGAVVSEAVQAAVVSAAQFVAAGGASGWRPDRGWASGDRATTGLPRSLVDGRPPVGLAAARAVAEATRSRGGTVVATGGCFDLLHAGHLATLQAARGLGDCLIVCLNSDASVRELKGPQRPIVNQHDRARLVAALGCVDAVVTFDETTPHRLLAQLRPDIWVKGGDYFLDGPDDQPVLPEADLVRGWGGQTVVVPYLSGRSTSGLISAARSGRLNGEGDAS
ncbi:MAG TPA: PfkB family carbohydrate kinase [Micromonosporaceae bacterium]